MSSRVPFGQESIGPTVGDGQAGTVREPTSPVDDFSLAPAPLNGAGSPNLNPGADSAPPGNGPQPNSSSADGVGLLPLFSYEDGVTFQAPQTADAGTGGTSTSSSTPTVTGNASGFVINVNYDASVASAPAGFTSTISSVVQYLESVITSPISVNIQVGYGEINGQSLGSGALGESETYLSSFSYSSIKNALSTVDPGAASSLPSSAPGTMWVSTAEAKALGLSGASSSVDGYAGFDSAANIFDYDKSNGITAGQYDFFGVVAHEFTEIMGRIDLFGVNIGGTPNSYDLLDMYHYTSPGVHTYTGTTTNYFSVDGGTTNIHNFNTNANGDSGDWASGSNDSFNAFSNSGVVNAVSPGDITAMNALGYGVSSGTSMKVDYFHAVDSKTGDYFNGIVYDNSGKYSVGGTVSFAEQLGGTWTYTITGIATADSAHQNSAYAGKVYDTYYYDADLGVGTTTTNGFLGYGDGAPLDTQYYSGANYLGSDGDYVTLNGSPQYFAYNSVVPESLPVMKVDYFHAVDSKTGDYFNGIVYDNTGKYSVGGTVSFAEQLGGTWTYTITSIATADGAHQNSAYSGKVYDTYYYDTDLGIGNVTTNGFLGYGVGAPGDMQHYSGTNYLGSDSDYVSLNGSTQHFAYNVAVAESAVMKVDYFHAVDSTTGDYFNGIVYDNTGKYSVGGTVSFAEQLGGTWTYTIMGIATADSAHQNSAYSGKVYDTYYYDTDLGIGNTTTNGFLGYGVGAPGDMQYYSGTNYLGSDSDYVSLNGSTQHFAYNVAVPEQAVMKVDYFHAVDSKTGDYFNGIVYDNTGKYSVSGTVSFADQLGGTWTYTITGIATADSTHQNSSYAGKVYDTYYYDADLGIGNVTTNGFLGYGDGAPLDTQYYSGTNYLGSDGDYVTLNGVTQHFAYNYTIPSAAASVANAGTETDIANDSLTKTEAAPTTDLAHAVIDWLQSPTDEANFDSGFATNLKGHSLSSAIAENFNANTTLGYLEVGSNSRGALMIENASTASAFGLLVNHMAAFAPSDAGSSQPLVSDLQSVTEQPLLTRPQG